MSKAGDSAAPPPDVLTAKCLDEPGQDERSIIQRAKEGDRCAFRLLVERYSRQAYINNIAYRFVGDHDSAADIAQEAFLKVHEALSSFRGDASLGTWLYRIVVKKALTRKRRVHDHERMTVSIQEFSNVTAAESTDELVERERQRHIERALRELPTLQRAVVTLRHLEGLSTKQVSEIFKCSEGTVKTHLFRGLKHLRRKLEFLKEGGS